MEYTKKELRKEAKLIKNYLKNNSYISDLFLNKFPYSFTAFEVKDKNITEISEMLERQIEYNK